MIDQCPVCQAPLKILADFFGRPALICSSIDEVISPDSDYWHFIWAYCLEEYPNYFWLYESGFGFAYQSSYQPPYYNVTVQSVRDSLNDYSTCLNESISFSSVEEMIAYKNVCMSNVQFA